MKKSRIIAVFILVIAEIVVFGAGYFTGYVVTKDTIVDESRDDEYNYQIDDTSDDETVDYIDSDNGETENEEADVVQTNKKVEKLIKKMTLSEKVYQMMFATPESITNVGNVVRAGESTKKALKEYPVGGIIYFSDNFEDEQQTKEMISNTQSFSEIPLFMAVDEEGGVESRLGSKTNMGTTKHPPMQEVGERGDFEEAYEIGKTLAKELGEYGFNVDFAPDADVIVNPKNTEIGSRSFGTDANLVAQMVKNVVNGIQDNGLSAAVKHFPGHGSTVVDTHTGFSASGRTLEELRNEEFLPFISGIEAGVDFVMVSHMTLTEATEETVPSSISEEVVTDMLINELGYNGIIITDSLQMGAIVEEYTIDDVAVKAIKAGIDMLLMPKDIKLAHDAIVKAVEADEISEERIDKSVSKILMLKYEKGMLGK